MKTARKNILFIGVTLISVFPMLSQESQTGHTFAYRSFSISPLGLYSGGSTGLVVSGDVSFDYGKNIFSLGIGGGTEGNFIGTSEDFTEVNLLYGRSFPLSDKVFTDVFIGAGYFHYTRYGVIDSNTGRRGNIGDTSIGIPIGAKFQFMFGPRYSMGLKVGGNINSVESLATLGLVLQWNSVRK